MPGRAPAFGSPRDPAAALVRWRSWAGDNRIRKASFAGRAAEARITIAHFRHRELLRRNCGGGRGGWRARPFLRCGVAAGDARQVRRRGSGAGFARALARYRAGGSRGSGGVGDDLDELGAIAVTQGPGLVGSLLVGMTYAKALCFARGIPLIGVNHIEGHIHAVVMEARSAGGTIELPALALVVSGGHTHLFEVSRVAVSRARKDARRRGRRGVRQGREAAGLRLSGRSHDRQAGASWKSKAVRFTLAKMKGNALDFSFSGLKTAVLRWTQSRDLRAEIETRRLPLRDSTPSTDEWLAVTSRETLATWPAFRQR